MACFLAEWQRSTFSDPTISKFRALLESCAEHIATTESPVRLIMVLAMAADVGICAVFEADTAETVLRVCRGAGAMPHRLTPDVEARIIASAPSPT